MASRAEIIQHIVDQIASAGVVRYLKMFGEYGIYCDEKMIALVADNQLYVKPTSGGREYIGEPEEAPPYPGAKLWFLIPEDNWDDALWLSELIRITTAETPMPKPKKPRKAKATGT